MSVFYSVARRAARVGQPVPFVRSVARLLLAVLLAVPVSGWAQAPAFTQAVSLNPTAAIGSSACTAIALDAAGNQYITGFFTGTLVLGHTTLVSAGSMDIFVAKRAGSTGAWLWAVRAGGSADDYGRGMAVDAAGNALVTGQFHNTASFATSPTATDLTSAGYTDVFVAKFSASTGTAVWAVRAGGSGSDDGRGMAVDAAGNALVTGSFEGTASFATSPTATGLTSAGLEDIFVAKFSASTGAVAWAVQAGGTNYDSGRGVAVDAAGNALVTGFFRNTASFATSPTATSLTSAGGDDVFVAKFGANTGAAAWAVRAGGSGSDVGNGMAVDAAGNALVTGNFTNTASFATSPTATSLTSAGGDDVFVAKFGASTGAAAWAVRAGGSGTDVGNGMAVDAAGNALVTGNFSGTASFATSPTATSLTSAGYDDVFVAKFGANTGAAAWAVQAGGGYGNDFGYGMVVDATGNALVTGAFTYTATFGSQTLTSYLADTGFVATLAEAGTLATTAPLLATHATLSPNPAPNAFTLTLPPVAGATTATATLLNALGQTISTRTLALAAGGTTAAYATAGLAPGLYTLRVQAGSEAASLRVVVP